MKFFKSKFFNKWKKTVVVLLLPIVSYLLLGPLEIYFGNEQEFIFGHTDFYSVFVRSAVIALFVGSVILALLPEKINNVIMSCVLGFGVASYIQNMFMNTKLSEADGSPMNWESLGSYPVINTIIFFGIVVLVVALSSVLKKQWDSISMAAAGFLSAIQLVAVFSLLLTATLNKTEPSNLQMSGDNQYKIAKNDNIIVFVLDTFGSTQLDEVLEAYPDVKGIMKDFTYYDNADCHYYTTFPSMTNMLTGNELDFSSDSKTWLSNAWNSEKANSFYDILKEKDYTCNIYTTDVGAVYGGLQNLASKFDNVKGMNYWVNTDMIVEKLFDMSIYRYVPYLLKPQFEVLTHEFNNVLIYYDGRGVVYDNAIYKGVLDVEELIINEDMENAFVIQHLFGTHAPYTMDENGNFTENATLQQTGRGLFAILDEYFNQMKVLGKYEDATIIVTADHGPWSGGLDPQPIFFIKQSGEGHDEMVINSAPISLDDFQATILDVLGEDYTDHGTSIYDWQSGQTRERSVFMRGLDENYPLVPGAKTYNVYYKYTYYLDKEELLEKIQDGPDEIVPATMWDASK